MSSADVSYTNDFTTPATVAVTLVVSTGSDYDAIFDEVQRQLWLSDLNPMDTVSMSAVDSSGDPALGQSRRLGYLSNAQRAAFEANYGPRPS